ncbi:hypothetical protein M513_03238 [Trichuris suis]|uniref:Arrestin C-terminal-like domain-containing protein n=1 Tax=Trichuris suis TaxID=68888 RepID=A0A085MF03_9BILA|nr:hypothetical protein M513_03238 [Trichuris suis]
MSVLKKTVVSHATESDKHEKPPWETVMGHIGLCGDYCPFCHALEGISFDNRIEGDSVKRKLSNEQASSVDEEAAGADKEAKWACVICQVYSLLTFHLAVTTATISVLYWTPAAQTWVFTVENHWLLFTAASILYSAIVAASFSQVLRFKMKIMPILSIPLALGEGYISNFAMRQVIQKEEKQVELQLLSACFNQSQCSSRFVSLWVDLTKKVVYLSIATIMIILSGILSTLMHVFTDNYVAYVGFAAVCIILTLMVITLIPIYTKHGALLDVGFTFDKDGRTRYFSDLANGTMQENGRQLQVAASWQSESVMERNQNASNKFSLLLGRRSCAELYIMVEELRIEYDHNPPVYFPGKSLKGRLVIVMSKACNVDSVKMFCLGEAFTRKVEARNRTSIGKFVLNAYSAKEQFFHFSTELVSPDVSSTANGKVDKLFLQQPGEHSFPFEFHLPPDCPQSFESNSGSIRYCCIAEIYRHEDNEKEAIKKITKRLFTILNGIDLNTHAQQESFSSEMQFSDPSHHHFVCRLQVPNVRVVPGEYVSTKLKVIHVGKKERVKEIVAQLVQKASYVGYKVETKEPTFWEERKVLLQNATRQKPDEKNGTTTTLRWDAVQIPPTAPTIDCGCSLLRVRYEMLYHVTMAKNQQQTFVIPIVVGVVPPRKRWPLFMSNRFVDGTSEERRQIIEPLINNYDDMRKSTISKNEGCIVHFYSFPFRPGAAHSGSRCSKRTRTEPSAGTYILQTSHDSLFPAYGWQNRGKTKPNNGRSVQSTLAQSSKHTSVYHRRVSLKKLLV